MNEPVEKIPPDTATSLLNTLWLSQEMLYCMLALDVNGTVIETTPGVEKVLGYGAAELVGRSVSVLFTAEDRAKKLDEYELHVAMSRGYSEDNRWHVRKDGSAIWVCGAMTAVHGPSGEHLGFVKIFRDRTDLRARLDTLLNRMQKARERERKRDADLLMIAHEMANSLAPMVSELHLLQRSPASESDRALHARIATPLDVLRRLVNDLRTIGGHRRVQGLQLHRIVLQDLLNRVIESVSERAAEKGLHLELLVPGRPIDLDADEARLHQVVLNLLTNAVKYTPPGGWIWVKGTVEGQSVVIRVEDTGVGISGEMLPRIFEMFTQEAESEPLSEGGMGVGLAVVRELVQLHRGTVEVRSEGKGKGSDFAIRLPLSIRGQ